MQILSDLDCKWSVSEIVLEPRSDGLYRALSGCIVVLVKSRLVAKKSFLQPQSRGI